MSLLLVLCVVEGMYANNPEKIRLRHSVRREITVVPDSVHLRNLDNQFKDYAVSRDAAKLTRFKTYYELIDEPQRMRIDSLHLNDIENAYDMENDSLTLFAIDKYLTLVPAENFNRGLALYVRGQTYLNREDWPRLYETVEEIEAFCRLTGFEMTQEIDELRTAYETVANYIPLEKDMVGMWVSDFCDMRRTKTPDLMFLVSDPTSSNGAMIVLGSSYYLRLKARQPGVMRLSQVFNLNGPMEKMELDFFSTEIQSGSLAGSQALYGMSQEIQGQVAGAVSSPNVSIGGAVLATGAATALSALFSAAGNAAAVSTSTTAVLKISASRLQPGVLMGEYTYHAYRGDSYGGQKDLGGWSQSTRFMKLEPQDNIVFADRRGQPIGLTMSKHDPRTAELFKLNRRYKFYQPQYLGSMIVGMGLGVALAVDGFDRLGPIYDENMEENENPSGSGTVLQAIFGVYFAMGVPFIVNAFRKHFKRKAVARYNDACYGRLRSKYVSEVSVSPTYFPGSDGVGMNVCCSF